MKSNYHQHVGTLEQLTNLECDMKTLLDEKVVPPKNESFEFIMNNTIIINGKPVKSQGKETILETAERNGIDIEYHCKDGYCGACRQSLISGKIKYVQYPLAFIHKGDVLTCCAVPVSNIEIADA